MKHVVDVVNNGQAGGATLFAQLALGTLNPDPYTNVTNVKAGSKIFALELQIDMCQEITGIDYVDWYIWFNINGVQAQPRPDIAGSSHLKNQIMHQEGALFQNGQNLTSVGVVKLDPKVWRLNIRIPRGWQQINDGDSIEFVYRFSNAGINHDTKIKCIYKEIFP